MLPLLLVWFTLVSLNQPGICLQQRQQLQPVLLPNGCDDKCGRLHIPFPFHLNTSCASVSNAFHLSCLNSTTLYLHIGIQSYRVLDFFSDGILVDFPGTGSSTCRQYNGLNSFNFAGNDYLGISDDNVIGLYDCEDSSLCKADCETNELPDCDGNREEPWHAVIHFLIIAIGVQGMGFRVLPSLDVGGFVVGSSEGNQQWEAGVKLEWAIPRNKSQGLCATNAVMVSATTVEAGVRCSCQGGLVGDGFANGLGCFKSCIKEGQEAYGGECDNSPKRTQKKLVIVAGVLAPVFILASLLLFLCILKRPVKSGAFDIDQAHYHSTISFRKACRTRLFSYRELDEATRGFDDGQKLVDGTNGTIHAGVLGDGSHIAVQKVQCENERDLIHVLSRIELLSAILHRNLARLLGCCIESGYTLMVGYEYPANGTLEEHLHNNSGQEFGLDWYKRLSIAAETASILAYLQCEISPPIFHHGLKSSGYIFLDVDFSVKVAGFALLCSSSTTGPHVQKNDVYDFGLLLLEIISGSKHSGMPSLALQKIKSGKLEEIVDPSLYYHEQPIFRREQIEIVADIATRCLLFGGDGKIGMVDVAKELFHLAKESTDAGSKKGSALEETFSNSSLLQMISMSPDSVHVPRIAGPV